MQRFKEFSFFVLLLLITYGFAGCSYSSVNDDKLADDIAQKIVKAIENKDTEALKALYSDFALDEIENFNESASTAEMLFHGKVIDFKGKTNQGSRRFGKGGYIFFCAKYDIETDEDSYIIEFWYCAMHREQPEKVGIQCIIIANKEDTLLNQKKYNNFIATYLKKDTMGFFLYEYEED